MSVVKSWAELGQRVREARLAAGRTQSELAAAVGVDRTAVPKIESGTRGLSAIELYALGDYLGLPLSHFVNTSPLSISSHRQALTEDSDETARKTFRLDALLEAHARDADWLRERGHLDASPWRAPEIHTHGGLLSRRHARDLAVAVRKGLSLEGPVEAMAEIMARAGQHVVALADVDAGASLILEPGFGVAIIGALEKPGRRRMTAAHELGHFILGDEYRTDIGVHASRDEREQCVEAFAAEFLLPSEALVAGMKTSGLSVRERLVSVSAEYRASWSATVQSARRLGLISESDDAQLSGRNPTRSEFIMSATGLPQEDLEAGTTSLKWKQAVLSALRASDISQNRAIELSYGALSEPDLADPDAGPA